MSADIYRQLDDLNRRLGRLESIDRLLSISGSWTPVLFGSTTAGTFTYATQSGRYVRIGTQVTAWFYIVTTVVSVAPVGEIRISGLPYTANSLLTTEGVAVLSQYDYITLTANTRTLAGRVLSGESVVRLVESLTASGPGFLTGAAISTINPPSFIGCAIYEAA